MNTTDDRIGTLEMRVERLETWAGPGQAESLSVNLRALRADVVILKRVQNQHGVLLGKLNEDVARLKADVSVLKADVSVLKADVSVLKADVSVLKADVSVLKNDVAELKRDVGELKVAVQEILRRLPSAPAA